MNQRVESKLFKMNEIMSKEQQTGKKDFNKFTRAINELKDLV